MIDLAKLGNNYPTVEEAVRGLLGDVAAILERVGEPYVVIGGWSPVLLAHGDVRHPGTRDVDLLFNGGDARLQLDGVFRRFLERDYLPSAKHPFQLIRVLQVSGQPMAFNVDLLHPRHDESDAPIDELFVEQLDLGVPLTDFLKDQYFMKSIVTPDIAFVFEDQRWAEVEFSSRLPDGSDGSGVVRVIDELALVVSKARSVTSVKRERDAFDIALSVAQARDPEALRAAARDLEDRRSATFSLLGYVLDAVQDIDARPSFTERVRRSVLPSRDVATAERLVNELRVFLLEIGVLSSVQGEERDS